MQQTLGFLNSNGAVSSCHQWTWTCVSVSSLSGRRCRSTMWRQVCSTREITWTARCLTATATSWPASLWRSSLVRFLFVLSSLKFGKANRRRLPFKADKAQSHSFLGWPIFPATSVSLPSTSLPNESISSSSSTGSQSTWKYTSMDETLHCCLEHWLHNTR